MVARLLFLICLFLLPSAFAASPFTCHRVLVNADPEVQLTELAGSATLPFRLFFLENSYPQIGPFEGVGLQLSPDGFHLIAASYRAGRVDRRPLRTGGFAHPWRQEKVGYVTTFDAATLHVEFEIAFPGDRPTFATFLPDGDRYAIGLQHAREIQVRSDETDRVLAILKPPTTFFGTSVATSLEFPSDSSYGLLQVRRGNRLQAYQIRTDDFRKPTAWEKAFALWGSTALQGLSVKPSGEPERTAQHPVLTHVLASGEFVLLSTHRYERQSPTGRVIRSFPLDPLIGSFPVLAVSAKTGAVAMGPRHMGLEGVSKRYYPSGQAPPVVYIISPDDGVLGSIYLPEALTAEGTWVPWTLHKLVLHDDGKSVGVIMEVIMPSRSENRRLVAGEWSVETGRVLHVWDLGPTTVRNPSQFYFISQ